MDEVLWCPCCGHPGTVDDNYSESANYSYYCIRCRTDFDEIVRAVAPVDFLY